MSQVTRKPKFTNTRRLQIFELSSFMLETHNALFDGVGFTSPVYETQYSFAQAVELFNEREDKDDNIVQRVKLRYCKKQKRVICTDHLVKLTDGFIAAAGRQCAVPFEALQQIQRQYRLR